MLVTRSRADKVERPQRTKSGDKRQLRSCKSRNRDGCRGALELALWLLVWLRR